MGAVSIRHEHFPTASGFLESLPTWVKAHRQDLQKAAVINLVAGGTLMYLNNPVRGCAFIALGTVSRAVLAPYIYKICEKIKSVWDQSLTAKAAIGVAGAALVVNYAPQLAALAFGVHVYVQCCRIKNWSNEKSDSSMQIPTRTNTSAITETRANPRHKAQKHRRRYDAAKMEEYERKLHAHSRDSKILCKTLSRYTLVKGREVFAFADLFEKTLPLCAKPEEQKKLLAAWICTKFPNCYKSAYKKYPHRERIGMPHAFGEGIQGCLQEFPPEFLASVITKLHDGAITPKIAKNLIRLKLFDCKNGPYSGMSVFEMLLVSKDCNLLSVKSKEEIKSAITLCIEAFPYQEVTTILQTNRRGWKYLKKTLHKAIANPEKSALDNESIVKMIVPTNKMPDRIHEASKTTIFRLLFQNIMRELKGMAPGKLVLTMLKEEIQRISEGIHH